MKPLVPVAAILPTRNRARLLERFLKTLHEQTVLPAEIIVCDASDDDATTRVTQAAITEWSDTRITWKSERALKRGLAPQRNQAVAAAAQPFVWFLDDDVILESKCLERLHQIISSDETVGGVTATITNQGYTPPGGFTSVLMRWFEDGVARSTYASACVGPGYTFMPDTRTEIPVTMPAEWLIGCCSMYRKSALPAPPVPAHFEAGALGEDLAASLSVGKTHRLLHVRDARCIHDSQGGDHKRSQQKLADQGLRNRYYIMTKIMGKTSARDHFDFVLMFIFSLLSLARSPRHWGDMMSNIVGYTQAVWKLLSTDVEEAVGA